MNNLLELLGYKLRKRSIEEIQELMKIYKPGNIPENKPKKTAYFGFEHSKSPKLPNITVLPNLRTKGLELMLGTTFGHTHTQKANNDTRLAQEIYEFLGYGAVLLRSNSQAYFYLLKPTEKVLVKTNDNMTLFNLSNEPLVTLDYANPSMNDSNKELEKKLKAFLQIYYNPISSTASFRFNPTYSPNREVNNLPIEVKLSNVGLGKELYERIKKESRAFERLGLNIRTESNIPNDLKVTFQRHLMDLALAQNPSLLNLFMIGKDNSIFKPPLIYDESGYVIGV